MAGGSLCEFEDGVISSSLPMLLTSQSINMHDKYRNSNNYIKASHPI